MEYIHIQYGSVTFSFIVPGLKGCTFTTFNFASYCLDWLSKNLATSVAFLQQQTYRMDNRGTGVPFPEEDIHSSLLQIVHISPGTHVTSYDSYILIIKANEMHNFSNLFDKVLYMFRTGPLSIIRSISTLYTRNRYLSC
jgi:hypothetical protein